MNGDERPAVRSPTADVLAAGGEIGRDLALVDWAATSVGPPAQWPPSLRTAVGIVLSSRFPMWLAWGPQLTFFCNAAYRQNTLGRKYPWALGRPANEVWEEIWDDIGPRIHTVLTTGQSTWDEALLLFLARSGYREETYHTFSYSPLRDDDGIPAGMLCVVSEDTERVIGERRMATLRDLGSDPSMVRTEQEMLRFAGRQLDRNRRDLPFTLTYLFAEDGRARLVASSGIVAGHPAAPQILRADDPGAVWSVAAPARGESTLVELDGARLPCGDWPEPPRQALLVPLLRQGAAPYGFLVAALNRYRPLDAAYRGFIDLTAGHVAAGIASARNYQAQQRRAEELAEVDRAKTAFFSNISHEFRTPLTLIMGPLEELRTRLGSADEGVREELELIRRNGLRLGKLVNTLLDFSRIEAGRMQARYEPVDLSAVTAELASVFRSAIERVGLTFEVHCPPLPEPVYLDRGMWEKVILNLLSNALKFTFDGSVRLSVRAEDRSAVVTIADTGVGVPTSEMPRLFERFHRIENARSRSNEGSGIGLALVKELVGLHGGSIGADSSIGAGTTFTIRLPLGSAHLPTEALAPPDNAATVSATADPFVQEALRWLPADPGGADPTASPTADLPTAASRNRQITGGPASVLVADDNADMREYLTRLLSTAGHRVKTVTDGQEALDCARVDVPDLIISDVMMPRLDGLRLLAALRGDPRTAGTPVLLLSARAGQEAAIEGLEAGADDYLVKPFSAAELLARARAVVELSRLRNHHARWRTALVNSLQEAFFVTEEDGTVIEINTAFTTILGYGPEGLPYAPEYPWWPDRDSEPDAHRQLAEGFAALLAGPQGSFVVPVTHRDGHRVWVEAAFSQVKDPDTGRSVIVGTFRDVTAEHYAVQRDSAVAGLSLRLSRAENLSDALDGALGELQRLWQARSVLAAIFDGSPTPQLSATDPELSWEQLPGHRREALAALHERPPLTPTGDGTGGGIAVEHPHGTVAIWIELGDRRLLTDHDRTLLTVLGGHLSQALHRIHQVDQQRETALALQHAILGPAQLPAGFAVRYQPAARPLKVGGDWYDTVHLPDERIGIVVGDCVGRGLQAATVMGQLRSACRALLLQDASPAQTLTALDRFAAQLPGAGCASVFCGILDPRSGHLRYSSAGHPPPIVTHADGSTVLLDGGRTTLLAINSGRLRPEAGYTLPPRASLLLYTDGLVERRRRPLPAGIDRAAAVVRDGSGLPIEDLASAVMHQLAPESGYEDDVALLLYRHPGPLELDLPAEATQLAGMRAQLRGWLELCGIGKDTTQGVLVAASEACANAVEHGYRNSAAGRILLRATATADQLRLTVSDSGSWKPADAPASPHRGRGIGLMRALADQVTVVSGAAGTTVDIQVRIAS